MWMRRATAAFGGFTRQESGQDLMEYGLLVSLIATFLVGALSIAGEEVAGVWSLIAAIQYTQP